MNKIKDLVFKKRQLVILAVFSVLISAGAIIHGIYMDLELAEVERLTIMGLIFTFVVVFPTLLFLEYSFDIDNNKKLKELENRIKTLEEKG